MNVPLTNATKENHIVTQKNHHKPKQRVSKDHVFNYIGIDNPGPIYVKNVYGSNFNMYKT